MSLPITRALRASYVFLLKIYRTAMQRRRLTLTVSFAVLLLCLPLNPGIRTLTSIDDIADDDFVTTPQLKHFKEAFHERNGLMVFVHTWDGQPFHLDELCAVRKWISERSLYDHSVLNILSPFEVRRALSEQKRVWYRPVLALNCNEKSDWKDSSTSVTEGLQALSASPMGGLLVPKDPKAALSDFAFEVYLNDDSTDRTKGSFDTSLVPKIREDFESRVQSQFPRLQSSWSGLSIFQYYTDEGYRAVAILNLVILIVLLVFMRVFFGSFRGALVFAGALISATVITKALMALFKLPIDLLSNNLFLMITLATIEDFVYLSFLQLRGTRNWKTPFNRLAVPSFYTSMTTIVGFGSLATSELGIIRRFGLLVSFGAMIEWVSVFVILPALIMKLPGWRTWVRPERAAGFKAIGRLRETSIPRYVGRLAMLVFPIALFAALHLKFVEFPENTFPKTHPFNQVLNTIERTRGFRSEASWVFTSAVDDARLQGLIAEAKAAFPGLIRRVEDPIEVENYVYAPVANTAYKEIRREFRGSLGSDRWYATEEGAGERRAILYLSSSETGKLERFRQWVAGRCGKDCYLAGPLVSFAEFGNRVRSTLLNSLWVSLALVALILVLLMVERGHSGVLPLIVSAFWAPTLMIVGLWAFHFPIYFISCLFASALVGMAGDNAIQFIFAKPGRSTPGKFDSQIQSLGGASQLVAIATISMALCFLGAYFAPARTLGLLLAGGFAFGYVGDYLLLRTWLKDPLLNVKRVFDRR